VLVWSPLAGGLMSGKYRRDGQPTHRTRQLTDWGEAPVRDREALYRTVDVLARIGQARGVSAPQVALAYLLERPAVTSPAIGARTAEQLADNLAAAELVLTAQEREWLDNVSELPLIFPYWHQANTGSDRLSPADLTLLGRHL